MKFAVRRNPGTGFWIIYRKNRYTGVYKVVGRSSNWRTAIRGL